MFVTLCVAVGFANATRLQHFNPQAAGLLQPLPVPIHVWSDITIVCVEGLLTSHRKNVILVVVDRFSKYCHLIALAHPYMAVSIARLFFNNGV